MSRFLLVLTLIATAALGACSSPRTDEGLSNSVRPLVEYNYDAADQLMQRAGARITHDTPMLVGTIGDVNNVESSSTLGRTITEQLSSRLAERGYKVAELKLRQGISIQRGGMDAASSGEYLLSRDVNEIAGQHKAAIALTGTYSLGAQNVLINLRLIDIRSGNIITGYDYVLPKNADTVSMVGQSAGYAGFFKPLSRD